MASREQGRRPRGGEGAKQKASRRTRKEGQECDGRGLEKRAKSMNRLGSGLRGRASVWVGVGLAAVGVEGAAASSPSREPRL